MSTVWNVSIYSLGIVAAMVLITGGNTSGAWMFAWGFGCAMLIVFLCIIMGALAMAKERDKVDAREQERGAPRERS